MQTTSGHQRGKKTFVLLIEADETNWKLYSGCINLFTYDWGNVYDFISILMLSREEREDRRIG